MPPKGKCPVCGEPSSSQKTVKPFCGIAHRQKNTNDRKKEDFDRFAASLAQTNDLVDAGGVVCCVKSVHINEQWNGTGFARTVAYDVTHTTWCGQVLDFPKALQHAEVSCMGCLSEGAYAVQRQVLREPEGGDPSGQH